MALAATSVRLNNGFKLPQVGLGTWKSEPNKVAEAVKDAIDIGYRHIDCAFAYENEKEVGNAIQAKINEGVVKRDDLFITSKLWNTFHSKNLVLDCLKRSLKDLQVEYVDLYLIHWPMGYEEGGSLFPQDANKQWLLSNVDYTETWEGMEQCCRLGLARSIGLSNFNSHQIQRILDMAEIKPVTNQVECHPYFKQQKLMDFCKSKGITLTAYACLGSPSRPWVTVNDPVVMDDPIIGQLAEKYKKTSAQICLRYQLQRGVIVIPKSVNKDRILSNFQIFDFKLSDADMKSIDEIPDQPRGFRLEWVKHHQHYPFNIPF